MDYVPEEIIQIILKYVNNLEIHKSCKRFMNYVQIYYKRYDVILDRENWIVKSNNHFDNIIKLVNISGNNYDLVKKIYGHILNNTYRLKYFSIKYIDLLHMLPNLYSIHCIYDNIIANTTIFKNVPKLKRLELLSFHGLYISIDKSNIPNITHLSLQGDTYSLDNLPDSLTHLEINTYYRSAPDLDNLPQSLIHLYLGKKINISVDNLPRSLTTIVFGKHFNKSVNYLPQTLTSITFGDYFNQLIDNLPRTLIYLKFGDNFNNDIDSLSTMSCLRSLSFGNSFNQNIDKLPTSLNNLTFKRNFNKRIDNLCHTCSLSVLIFGRKFNLDISSLSQLTKLTYLSFGHRFNRSINNLPPNLMHLGLGRSFKAAINNLPNTLINMHVSNIDCINMFPSNLKYLELGLCHSIPMKRLLILPDTLETLKITNTDTNDYKLLFNDLSQSVKTCILVILLFVFDRYHICIFYIQVMMYDQNNCCHNHCICIV